MNVYVHERAYLERSVWPRPLIVISDLHENSAGRHDNCQRDLLYEFLLGFSPKEYDLLILGDWHDYWEEPRGARIYEHNEKLERLIALFRLIFKPGNHDDVPGCFYTEFDRHGFFCWHGDQLDPACRGRGTLGKAGSKIWGSLERIGLGYPLAGVKHYIVRQANRRIKTAARRGGGNEAYIADAERRDKPLYMNGHTHKPELIQWAPGRVYANPGSWVVPDTGNAVLVDGREVRLVEVTP